MVLYLLLKSMITCDTMTMEGQMNHGQGDETPKTDSNVDHKNNHFLITEVEAQWVVSGV